MALGIDQAGHKGAMDGGGLTYAVMGCGIDTCYPHPASGYMRASVNKAAYCQNMDRVYRRRHPIFQSGTGSSADFRPGAGRGARKRSGSLITADLALEQGKEVFALPGRRIDPLSEGCNRLIAQGAGIVTKPEDVLDFFHIKCKNSCKKTIKSVNALAKSEKSGV